MADREEFATEVGELIKGRSPVGHTHSWDAVTGKPTSFPPAAHSHDDRYPRVTLPDIPTSVTNILSMADGDYGERFGAAATVERGYPPAGNAPGWFQLRTSSSGSMRWAAYRPFNRAGEVWENRFANGSWVGWKTIFDTAIYDRLTVLEYDTGWRSFTPVGPGFTGDGKILFRRMGAAVYCRFESVGVTAGITAFTYLTDGGFIPTGFRPEYGGRPVGIMSNLNANPNYLIGIAQGSRFRYQATFPSGGPPTTGSSAIVGQMSWSTLEARPNLATLPGDPA